MSGFIDLHSHWLPGIDDGATTSGEGLAILAALRRAGFEQVIATPHMRPGMFDNTRSDLERAFQGMLDAVQREPGLPRVGLASEHYFDDVVFQRILDGDGLPYPGDRAVLLEFYEVDLPRTMQRPLGELRSRGWIPVIAHPERYRAVWKAPECLEPLLDAGAVALLDAAALVGKYGSQPRDTAEHLLERGCYYAACSDAHRASDVDDVVRAMRLIEQRYGQDEVGALFCDGPRDILSGTVHGTP